MLGHSSSIVIPAGSAYGKEMARHEATYTQFGPPGRPYVYQEYPRRVYRAEYESGKGIRIVEAQTVEDPQAERALETRGFRFHQHAAIALMERQQTEFGALAAEREWQIRHGRVSARAVAEVRSAEADHGAQHLPDVPETPIRRRVRRTKAQMAAAATT